MAVNIRYIRKRSLVSSKYMDLIVQSSQIAYKLVPVDKRAISQIKRPYYIQKKNLQNITCKETDFSKYSITFTVPLCVYLLSSG